MMNLGISLCFLSLVGILGVRGVRFFSFESKEVRSEMNGGFNPLSSKQTLGDSNGGSQSHRFLQSNKYRQRGNPVNCIVDEGVAGILPCRAPFDLG